MSRAHKRLESARAGHTHHHGIMTDGSSAPTSAGTPQDGLPAAHPWTSPSQREVRSALVDLLDDVASGAGSSPGGDYVNDSAGIVDWSAVSFTSSMHRQPAGEAELAQLSLKLRGYLLEDGALDMESDSDGDGCEDLATESPMEEPEPADEALPGAFGQPNYSFNARRRGVITDEAIPSFPWPDKEVPTQYCCTRFLAPQRRLDLCP
ncbi:hypothetical protein GY45DRAFT_879996 [Cubamyces sp. BRFM 1775]|nr:hypothetical protein GY45DRAFT_879996 [Cubamyces sp. BRFM 1775]